jgi:POT family proton-dependent oligopeptide transporter
MAVGQTEGRPAERTLFGHPVGLANLFGVELWERFRALTRCPADVPNS